MNDLLEAAGEEFRAAVGFELTRRFSGIEWVFGWNPTAGLPKTPDLAVRAGAAFLFERRGTPLETEELAVLGRVMETIEATGIGERRAEGFGRVIFCDAFHWRGEYKRDGGNASATS